MKGPLIIYTNPNPIVNNSETNRCLWNFVDNSNKFIKDYFHHNTRPFTMSDEEYEIVKDSSKPRIICFFDIWDHNRVFILLLRIH